jgi:poly [ADP-ribose] polymerase 10/14/15
MRHFKIALHCCVQFTWYTICTNLIIFSAVAFGKGVYFAVEADYSCDNTYSVPDPNGVKRMYYCRVLTGEYTKGSHGLRQPPEKPSGGPHSLYDSVINDPNNIKMFVVFNDTQAYPEYILSFK